MGAASAQGSALSASAQGLAPRVRYVGCALAVVAIVLLALSVPADGFVFFAPYAAVAGLIAYRQPRNAIGWIMLVTALAGMICADAGWYSGMIYRQGHHALPLGRLSAWLAGWWALFIVGVPLPIALFPDGRLPGGRWRVTVWLYGALVAVAFVWVFVLDLHAFTDRVLHVNSQGELNGSSSTDVLLIPYLAITLSWVAYQVTRFRGSTGDTRAQLKWMMSGGAVTLIGLVVGISSTSILQAAFIGVLALPICMTIAILRYRLYDIDRIVSRTVGYGIVTALSIGIFVGLVALTTDLLSFSSEVGVAASTLAAAALFNPLRARVQRAVDRRFNRARYDAEATVNAFAARLRNAVDLDTVQADLLSTVNTAVEPTHVSVSIIDKPLARV